MGQVVRVIAERIENLSPMLSGLGLTATDAGYRQVGASHEPGAAIPGQSHRINSTRPRSCFPVGNLTRIQSSGVREGSPRSSVELVLVMVACRILAM